MDEVIIYGAGGLGCVAQDILQQGGRYRPIAFLDSDRAKWGTVVAGLPVRGGPEQIETVLRARPLGVVVAIGDNMARVAVAQTLRRHGLTLVSAIHPLASISPSAELAEHLIIGPRVTVCIHTCIGPHCVLSAGAIAEHDNVLGQGVFLAPAVRLAGAVTIADFATVGIGACVIPGRRVGRGARVEAGAVVIQDVPARTVVGGVPAAARGSQATPVTS